MRVFVRIRARARLCVCCVCVVLCMYVCVLCVCGACPRATVTFEKIGHELIVGSNSKVKSYRGRGGVPQCLSTL